MSLTSSKNITTIVAPATLVGESSITVVRISGPRSFEITDKLFSHVKCEYKSKNLIKQQGYTLHHGYIFNRGKLIDEVIVSLFRSPNSYTGEDLVEVSLHGGKAIFSKIIELYLHNGCVYAQPGEFTKRAFLNGKIDLIQAEAVADLIRAETEQSVASATMQLSGRLTAKINELREKLINLCSLLELELDFSEEGLEIIPKEKIIIGAEDVLNKIREIVSTYEEGRILREGVNLTITGKPNVGKSSIFNYMLNDSRAIVSEIPGTTRDYLEESLILGGIKFNLVDTAGIRETQDEIEKIGVEKSYKKIKDADIIINVYDATKIASKTHIFKKTAKENNITVVNKADLLKIKPKFKGEYILVSAKTGKNMKILESKIIELSSNLTRRVQSSDVYITNIRHKNLLVKSAENLTNAVNLARKGKGNELVSFEIREAITGLEEILGKTTNTEILNNIFSKFCIGK